MGTFTILESPQQILTADNERPLMLVNNGIATIYLDAVPGVNTLSYPLPPLATMVWDAYNPLWVAIAPQTPGIVGEIISGTLSTVPNTSLADAARAQDQVKLFTGPTIFSAGLYYAPRIETTSYNTLQVQIQWDGSVPSIPTLGKYLTAKVSWLVSAAGGGVNVLSQDEILIPQAALGTTVFALPVKGASCVISIIGITPTYVPSTITVFGFTRQVTQYLAAYPYAFAGVGTVLTSSDTITIDSWDYADVWIPAWSNRIQISLFLGGSTSAAGVIYLADGVVANTYYTRFGTGTGSGLEIDVEKAIPLTRFVRLGTGPAPTVSGAARLTITYL